MAWPCRSTVIVLTHGRPRLTIAARMSATLRARAKPSQVSVERALPALASCIA
jgi:hypothetical protein